MNNHIEKIQKRIQPLRTEIISHKVYSLIESVDDLKIFMQYHVYAVWDFMSLLKSLQNNLTCTSIPWYPKGSADTRYLINEIVIGEESDIDQHGIRKSHFEIYLDAMKQCNADTSKIETLLSILKMTTGLDHALSVSEASKEAVDFVKSTFNIIESNKNHLLSAIFTFGREYLIPDMFLSIVDRLHEKSPESISTFKYYLERHIEVDGDQHSHLALEMTANLCGADEKLWLEAENAIVETLQKRIGLWDGIYNEILLNKSSKSTSNISTISSRRLVI
jgi:hypothetical protein